MARSFTAWKAWATVKLLALKAAYRDDRKIASEVDALLTRLHRLKLEGVPGFLVQLHRAAADTPELLDLLPSEEEVTAWFEGG